MIRKWIKCAGERIEDRLRRVCGAMNPDIRVYAIVTLFVLFAALSLYSTVSAIYSLGRNDGERIRIEHLQRLSPTPATGWRRSRGTSRNPSGTQMQCRSRKQPFPLKQNEHSPGRTAPND